MGIVSSNISGAPFNGGTVAAPLGVADNHLVPGPLLSVTTSNATSAAVALLVENTDAGSVSIDTSGNLFVQDALGNTTTVEAGVLIVDVAGVGGVLTAGSTGVLVGVDKVGFFAHAPAVQPTGVAVSAAGIHAALVSLGIITA